MLLEIMERRFSAFGLGNRIERVRLTKGLYFFLDKPLLFFLIKGSLLGPKAEGIEIQVLIDEIILCNQAVSLDSLLIEEICWGIVTNALAGHSLRTRKFEIR